MISVPPFTYVKLTSLYGYGGLDSLVSLVAVTIVFSFNEQWVDYLTLLFVDTIRTVYVVDLE